MGMVVLDRDSVGSGMVLGNEKRIVNITNAVAEENKKDVWAYCERYCEANYV